jgi:hypothetical protein
MTIDPRSLPLSEKQSDGVSQWSRWNESMP